MEARDDIYETMNVIEIAEYIVNGYHVSAKKPIKALAQAYLTILNQQENTVEKIFSGDASRDMWDEINNLGALHTVEDVGSVLYGIGCKLQQLENKLVNMIKANRENT